MYRKVYQAGLVPYLQQAGFSVIDLPITQNDGISQTTAIADSLGVNYILTGNAKVSVIGNSTFMEQLTVHVISTETREIMISGSFSGTSIRPLKAAGKIGQQIVNKMK